MSGVLRPPASCQHPKAAQIRREQVIRLTMAVLSEAPWQVGRGISRTVIVLHRLSVRKKLASPGQQHSQTNLFRTPRRSFSIRELEAARRCNYGLIPSLANEVVGRQKAVAITALLAHNKVRGMCFFITARRINTYRIPRAKRPVMNTYKEAAYIERQRPPSRFWSKLFRMILA